MVIEVREEQKNHYQEKSIYYLLIQSKAHNHQIQKVLIITQQNKSIRIHSITIITKT